MSRGLAIIIGLVAALAAMPIAAQSDRDCDKTDRATEHIRNLRSSIDEADAAALRAFLRWAGSASLQERGASGMGGWPSKTLTNIQQSEKFQALSTEDQDRFHRIWSSFDHYYLDQWTAKAASNLLTILDAGALSTDHGSRLLRVTDELIAKDAGLPTVRRDRPFTSDAILVLGTDVRVAELLRTGRTKASPDMTQDRILRVAGEVTELVEDGLTAQNTVSGAFSFVLSATGNDILQIFGGGIDDDLVGVAGVRDKAGMAGSMHFGHSPEDRMFAWGAAEKLASLSHVHGWGNCQEHAVSVATKLQARGVAGVEVMGRAGNPSGGGTHAFVVVGRDPHSDPNDPSTWGDNAIVVDAWNSDDPYNASELVNNRDKLPGYGNIETRFRLVDK